LLGQRNAALKFLVTHGDQVDLKPSWPWKRIGNLFTKRRRYPDAAFFPRTTKELAGYWLDRMTRMNQGCGAGTKISGSSSGHLNISAPAPTSRSFWLQNNLVQKSRKSLYHLYNALAPQTISVEPELNFQAPIPPFKKFW